jgi:hypothetical protein
LASCEQQTAVLLLPAPGMNSTRTSTHSSINQIQQLAVMHSFSLLTLISYCDADVHLIRYQYTYTHWPYWFLLDQHRGSMMRRPILQACSPTRCSSSHVTDADRIWDSGSSDLEVPATQSCI